jgi:hypothetical protein
MAGENEQAIGQEEEVKDEFGDAFKEAAQEKTPEELEAEARESERAEREGVGTSGGKQPEGQADERAGEEPDYKKLYDEEHQRRSTLQGMYNSSREELDQLKKAQPLEKGEAQAKGNEGEVSAEDLLKTLALEDDDDVKFMLDEYDYLAKPLQKIVAKALTRQQAGKQQPSAEELTKQVLDMVGQQVHQQTIKTAHPDFDTLASSGELKMFVESLPDGEDKTRLNGYYQHGTADDVISLIDSYKDAKGIKTQAGNDKDSKIRNLTAVKSRHTPVDVSRKTGNSQSYGDAFDEAVSQSGRR